MRHPSGQAFRRLGLTIEAVAMLAMLGTHRGQIEFWERINVNPNVALPIIFAIGIGLWIRGTLLIRKERMEGGG